ncbi:Mor transcription activator family protein [Clostridium sp. YIM B02551]|uniref:Mor transcription activator family protein n=1 Tax=Clostridium sp. YIM B02551 TaxID=2910679 RepID=UPI001EEC69BE|nr:Mor transcription activator family protein [Clostridium sp. YIM B02551]
MKYRSSDFSGIYESVHENLGFEIVREIYKYYKGQQITFPMRLYSKEYVIKYISENYDGKNIKELARDLEYTEKWIRKLVNDNKLCKGDKEK